MSYNSAQHHLNNLFGDGSGCGDGAHGRPGNSPDVHGGSTMTPAILLEQLAYVDNFMTDLDNDFSNLDVLLDGNGVQNEVNLGLSLDERLAAELSAFADESFIFPDEDKRDRDGKDDRDADQEDDDDADDEGGSKEGARAGEYRKLGLEDNGEMSSMRKAQFYSERRNNLLASQYDYTRQRLSKRQNSDEQVTPGDDHGGFTNFDIAQQPQQPVTNLIRNEQQGPERAREFRSSSFPNGFDPANSHNNAYFLSNSAYNSSTTRNDDYTRRFPNIQLPDYPSVPTSTLVALLPKIEVPQGAYQSLLGVGFSHDQIDAISAIIAYHQTHGMNSHNNALSAATAAAARYAVESPEVDLARNYTMRDPASYSESGPLESLRRGNDDDDNNNSNRNAGPGNSTSNQYPFKSSLADNPVALFLDFLTHGVTDEQTSQSSTDNQPYNQSSSRRDNRLIQHEKSAVNDLDSDFFLLEGRKSDRKERKDSGDSSDSRDLTPLFNTGDTSISSVPTSLSTNSKSNKNSYAHVYHDDGSGSLSNPTRLDRNDKHNGSVNNGSSIKRKTGSGTPASSRSHLKRKQKEKELETSVRELSELATTLKQRIQTLEMENRLLKNIVMDKGEVEGIKRVKRVKRESVHEIREDK
ncbi:Met4p Ecym_5411 [Eremothecium cymbalariae DBVPG|uniref:BZIP domain-containing protein n=1 Tax=Eremothecium cymbalariae (strain CBS 270.75 / DBVPG 7215 / KCTC 17166 / NRRL Y-17582) TaxID=931890 RepID=I6NDM3_ERECY|nr:hypothetical protein Ecym_5411 [Eremothecium cymbalariae DBVPG\